MPIVCGTDFSNAAGEAARAAAALARRLNDTLILVHAVEPPGLSLVAGGGRQPAFGVSATELMSHAAEALRERGVVVSECVKAGSPEAVLAGVAAERQPSLVLIGAPEPRHGVSALLGSTVEETIRLSPVPVLAVREAAPLEEWLEGKRVLHVTVATDLSPASHVAVDWVASLRRIAPVDVVLAHVFWPPTEHVRLEIPGPIFHHRIHPIVKEVLERELTEQARTLGGSVEVSTWFQPELGRTADPLVRMATERRADLLVVGTHQRRPIAQLWCESVSKRVLRLASMSVACVPLRQQREQFDAAPVRTILAATDFSATGNLAVAHAYTIAQRGSRVILLHAVKSKVSGTPVGPDSPEAVDAVARLEVLVPAASRSAGVESETRVVEGRSAAATICGAAERYGASIVVLGTEGRAGLARPVFGSVAQEVMLRSRCPVLIVPPACVFETRLFAPAEAPEATGA